MRPQQLAVQRATWRAVGIGIRVVGFIYEDGQRYRAVTGAIL